MQIVLDAGSIAMALTAVAALFASGWRFVLRPVKDYAQTVHEVVTRELEPNGGSSMHDRVRSTAAEVVELRAKLDAHVSDADRHHAHQHHHRTATTEGPAHAP